MPNLIFRNIVQSQHHSPLRRIIFRDLSDILTNVKIMQSPLGPFVRAPIYILP